jgi:hypothetical protein
MSTNNFNKVIGDMAKIAIQLKLNETKKLLTKDAFNSITDSDISSFDNHIIYQLLEDLPVDYKKLGFDDKIVRKLYQHLPKTRLKILDH